jgi:hypothetical protein
MDLDEPSLLAAQDFSLAGDLCAASDNHNPTRKRDHFCGPTTLRDSFVESLQLLNLLEMSGTQPGDSSNRAKLENALKIEWKLDDGECIVSSYL